MDDIERERQLRAAWALLLKRQLPENYEYAYFLTLTFPKETSFSQMKKNISIFLARSAHKLKISMGADLLKRHPE